MERIISIHEFYNSPMYEDYKVGHVTYTGGDKTRNAGYACYELYPHKIVKIDIKDKVKITYEKL